MVVKSIINELKENCTSEEKNEEASIYKSFQTSFLDGYIGVIINELSDKKYEVYSYIKDDSNITCPLLYKKYDLEKEAVTYYDSILEVISTKNIDKIIDFIKKGY